MDGNSENIKPNVKMFKATDLINNSHYQICCNRNVDWINYAMLGHHSVIQRRKNPKADKLCSRAEMRRETSKIEISRNHYEGLNQHKEFFIGILAKKNM
jgi:hypothetical protein